MPNMPMTTWLAENRLAGKVVLRVGRRGDELIAEFANVGRLTMTSRGERPHFEPVAGVSSAALEKARATVVDAFVRHAQGKLTLHGGAISKDSRAVALVGPSRCGKSTLTAALCTKPGIGLMADDTVAIELSGPAAESVEVVPTQHAAWLLPDACQALGFRGAARGKAAVPLPVEATERAVLALIIGLVFDPDAATPQLRRLRGHEAFSTVFNAAFRFVIDDPAAQLREFDQLRVVVENCPIYELRRSPDLGQLKLAAGLIQEYFASSHPSDGAG